MPQTPDRITLGDGLSVSRLICGLWQVADLEKDGATLDPDRGADALQAYARAGFDTFDMADHYGSAELITGRLLARYAKGESRPVAFTKWCPEPGPMTADIVRKGVQERLDRLGVEKVDLLQFHWWTFEHPAWLDALHEMARLKDEGLIGAIGVTNFDAAHLRVALSDGIPLATNQVSFSLLDRRAAGDLSALCRERGVKLLAYGTLCGGFLSDKWLGKPEPQSMPDWSRSKYKRFIDVAGGWAAFQGILAAAGEIARKHGVSISNVATRWVLEHDAVAAAIIGARITESEHRSDNLKLFGFALDAEDQATPRRGLRRDEAHSRRLRRRIPPAALSHRVGRPQPSPRRHPLRLQGRAGAGHARAPARVLGQRLGADRRLQPRHARQGHDPRVRHHRHAWRRPLRRARRPGGADDLHPRQDRGLDHRARWLDGGHGPHPHLPEGRGEMGTGLACPWPGVRRDHAGQHDGRRPAI